MNDLKSYYQTVVELLWNEGHQSLSKFCYERYMSDYIAYHDNWGGGIDTYDIVLEVPVSTFSNWTAAEGGIENKESIIKENFKIAVKGIQSIDIGNVVIIRPTAVAQNEMPQNKKLLKQNFILKYKINKVEGLII